MSSILLLDDDVDLRALLSQVLEGRGLQVHEANTAAEADAIMRSHDIDVAVVDGMLPDITGIEFIEKLRARGDATCIVFLSAFFRDLKTLSYLTEKLDVASVCYKPVEVRAFADVVERIYDEQSRPKRDRSTDDELREKLLELRNKFASRLPERMRELSDAIAMAPRDPAELVRTRRLVHHLRGSSGSYGFPNVGEAAGVLEEVAAGLIDTAAAADDPAWNTLREAGMAVEAAARVTPNSFFAESLSPKGAPQPPLLIVDDDGTFLDFARSAAKQAGLEILTATTSPEAVSFARTHQLSGALIDVRLDVNDENAAFDLAKQMRAAPGNEELPIAFASAAGGIQARVAAIEAGGIKFLEKPLSADQIADALSNLVATAQQRQARLLIIDDDQDVTERYSALLRSQGYSVDVLHAAKDLVDTLDAQMPDVLLLDVELPHVSGVDICRALRQSSRWQLLPIVVVTAHDDARTRLACFRAGASDVITKPVLGEELAARVASQVERAELVRDRSDRDQLSRLMTRRAFIEAFQRSLSRAKRLPEPISLVMLDLDHFKSINDTYGHLMGDRVIAKLGELLRQRFRIGDLRARWGGEEFVVAFPGQDAAFAREAAIRLLSEFRGNVFVTDQGVPFQVTFTAGVASWPEDGSTLAALLGRADDRLYRGKRDGRSSINISSFPPQIPEKTK